MKKVIAVAMLLTFGLFGTTASATPLMSELKPMILIQDRFDDKLTRAELATVLTRLFELNTEERTTNFVDAKSHWAVKNGSIPAVIEAKLLQGLTDTHFKPDATVTVEQLVVALMRGHQIPLDTSTASTVPGKIELDCSPWASKYVYTAFNKGFVSDKTSFRSEVKRKDVFPLVRAFAQNQRSVDPLITEIKIDTDKNTGKTNFTFTVRNTGTDTVPLEYNTSQRYDLKITDDKGNIVEHLSADQMFMQVLGEGSLGPDETLVYEHEYKLEKGRTYTIEFWITAAEYKAHQIATFTVQ